MMFGDLINPQKEKNSGNIMKERNIISHFLTNTSPKLHKTRISAIADCVVSILSGHTLTVTTVGRGIDSNALPKHKIKRMDRLCSNPHLYNEIDVIYGGICKQWVAEFSRPIILIDWSDLDDCKNAFLISASLAYDGRSITLYSETHSLKTKEKPATHKAFLNKLKALLPDTCNPIVVTDAGFKAPWFRLVLSLGWDYVGRVRKPHHYSYDGNNWHNITALFEQATSSPKSKQ